MAVALTARFGFVTEVGQEPGSLNILALWNGEGFGENFTYQVKGTPCERVLAKDLVSIQKDVQKAYPEDAWLGDIGAQSYMAVPLLGPDGSALGHIGILHDATVEATQERVAVLQAFASRASGEPGRALLGSAATWPAGWHRGPAPPRLSPHMRDRTDGGWPAAAATIP